MQLGRGQLFGLGASLFCTYPGREIIWLAPHRRSCREQIRDNVLTFSNPHHEPVRVLTFRPELAVEALDERVVGRLSWPREVQHDAALDGKQDPDLTIADTFTRFSPAGDPRRSG